MDFLFMLRERQTDRDKVETERQGEEQRQRWAEREKQRWDRHGGRRL